MERLLKNSHVFMGASESENISALFSWEIFSIFHGL
jgi:hypothetical protein